MNGAATALANLFAGLRLRRGAHNSQEPGAKLHMPPMNIQVIGRMAVMAYPQGAAFAVFATACR
jgi:predicted enzyme related to lactoylglutathione lyase